MKKLLIGACAVMALAAGSCGKCGSDKCATSSVADSTAVAYGNFVGTILLQDYNRFDKHEKSDKEKFLKGVQLAMGCADDKNMLMGVQVGSQIINELEGIKAQTGVELDKATVLKAFKQAFLNDTLSIGSVEGANAIFRTLLQHAQDEMKAEQEAKAADEAAAAQDEAKANGEAARKFVEDAKAADSSIKTTASGLSYKITEPGTGDKPAETANVTVNYTGRHLNGDVFDSSEGRGPATFALKGVVPGFAEGLRLLGKGGKATLYIPGELAYGENGAPQAGIGPNEMLIFDVELIEIN